jgi:hypothetical protein
MIGIAELFSAAGLPPCGPVCWCEPVLERGPGIYVIVAKPGRVIYIGRASRSVAKRLGQFYRHNYGAHAPHRGGQESLLLLGPKEVYWAPTTDFEKAEAQLIAAFVKQEGQLPFGNKRRGDHDPI